ncbi:beta strand repeat-containing protein, partial [Polymorphobacter multimanifer]|uniref:beta strand repeat-containing protein n=1 Tax=Polymorphobacter multimanifer TaxID=1070431 RepID=UPI001666E9DB
VGSGRLILSSANNSFSGNILFERGRLYANADEALGTGTVSTSTFTVRFGTLVNQTVTLSNDIVANANINFDLPMVGNSINLLGDISGTGVVFLAAGTGSLGLYGDNVGLSGGVTVNNGGLDIGTSTALGTGALVMGTNSSRLRVMADGLTTANNISSRRTTEIDTQGFTYTLTGAYADRELDLGGLRTIGSGSLVLDGTVTATNGVFVDQGSVTVNGAVQNQVTVAAGASVGGDGSVGSLTVNGGNLSPGNSAGTLTVVGDLTLDAASTLSIELAMPGVVGGGINDLIEVGGSLTLDGTATFAAVPTFVPGVFTFITYVGSLVDNGLDVLAAEPEFQFTLVDPALTPNAIQVMGAFIGTSLFWDGAGAPLGDGIIAGGSGTWSDAATNWTVASGNANLASTEARAVFGTIGGDVLVDGAKDVTGIDFEVTGYALTGDDIRLTQDASINVAGAASIANNITGAFNLALDGGELALSGNNSFQTLDINSGFVVLGSNTAFGLGAVQLSVDGGLRAGAEGLVIANGISINGANDQVTIDTNGFTLTFDGAISGAGAMDKAQAGTLVLSGNNSFARLSLGEGAVRLGSNTAAGSGAITLEAGGDAAIEAGVDGLVVGNAIVTDGALTVDSGAGTFTLGGEISGTGSIGKAGAGTLILGTPTLSSGGTTLDAGTLQIGDNDAIGSGSLTIADGATLAAGTDGLVLANDVSTAGVASVDGGAGTFTIAGVIDGVGSIAKDGSGTLVLAGLNSYLGGTALQGGTIRLGSSTALGAGSLVMSSGTTLASGAADLDLANDVTLLGSASVLTGVATMALSGSIDGAGPLTKGGGNALVLAGNNSYTGGTNLQAGAIFVANNNALGTGVLAMSAATTLIGADGIEIGNAITLAGISFIGPFGPATSAFTLDGEISGGGSISKIGAGTLVINGANIYAGGTALTAGTIMVGDNAALGAGALSMADGTTLRGHMGDRILANQVIITGAGILDSNGSILGLTGLIGGGALNKIGGGQLRLSGSNTYGGGTTLDMGSIAANNDLALGTGLLAMADGSELVGAGGTRTLANDIEITGTGTINDDGNVFTLNGTVGGGILSKVGNGELVLNGDNGLGGLVVNTGIATLGTNTAAGIGAVTLAGGTTLRAGIDGLVVANAVDLLASATIDNNGAAAFTLDGVISGAGPLLVVNTPGANLATTLVLTGVNTYTGGTIVTGTTVQIAADSALGAAAGGLTLAFFAFDRARRQLRRARRDRRHDSHRHRRGERRR